jgi:hypothetical protein
VPQASAIFVAAPVRGTRGPFLPERQVAAENGVVGSGKAFGKRDKERPVAVGAGAVREREAAPRLLFWPMEIPADGGGGWVS